MVRMGGCRLARASHLALQEQLGAAVVGHLLAALAGHGAQLAGGVAQQDCRGGTAGSIQAAFLNAQQGKAGFGLAYARVGGTMLVGQLAGEPAN